MATRKPLSLFLAFTLQWAFSNTRSRINREFATHRFCDTRFARALSLCRVLGLAAATVGAFDDERLHRLLRLPEGERPLLVLAVGHPH